MMIQSNFEATDAAAFYPLKTGNEWTYEVTGDVCDSGESVKFTVLHSEDASEGRAYHLWMDNSDGGKPLSFLSKKDGLFELETDRLLLRPHMSKGMRWQFSNIGWRNTQESASIEVLAIDEQIRVGGFTFPSCVVILENQPGFDLVSETTYARGIGPVKYIGLDSPSSTIPRSSLTITSWKVKES